MQVQRVRDVYIKSICLYAFVSCKESTKRRQSARTEALPRDKTTVWVLSGPNRVNQPPTALTWALAYLGRFPSSLRTYEPSLFRYLSRDVPSSPSHPPLFLETTIEQNMAEITRLKNPRPGRTLRDTEMSYFLSLRHRIIIILIIICIRSHLFAVAQRNIEDEVFEIFRNTRLFANMYMHKPCTVSPRMNNFRVVNGHNAAKCILRVDSSRSSCLCGQSVALRGVIGLPWCNLDRLVSH